MPNGPKRWPLLVVAAVLVVGAVVFVRHRQRRIVDGPMGEPRRRADNPWKGFAAGVDAPARPADAGAPLHPNWFAHEVTPDQVSSAMETWREAILHKKADQVLPLDRAFGLLPGRYGPALLKVAETDPDERVRAFSTRSLGKMKNPELVEDFQRLLADKSPFVRQNAAWALGELATRPEGKAAAGGALDDLRQVSIDDPVTDVRAAATNALKVLQ
jgi:hypothetical protein